MRIGLVADIPHEPVTRRIEYPMQRDGKLHHAETGPQVPASHRYRVDHLLAQFGRQLRQIGRGKLAQILWELHEIEERRL